MDMASLWNRTLSELPTDLFLRLRDYLDVSYSPNQGWRAIVANLNERYVLSSTEDFERRESPTTALLIKLRSLGMTIQEFVECATRADDYVIMELFDVHTPVTIVHNPLSEISAVEGETVEISIEAKGFPPPQYQWYKDNMKLEMATENVLRIYNFNIKDEGEYKCSAYNDADISKQVFSTSCKVYVEPVQPVPPLEIKDHPRPCFVFTGGTAVFKCEVWSSAQLSYQWYKNEQKLQDGLCVQGSSTEELRIKTNEMDSLQWEGNYFCQISLLHPCINYPYEYVFTQAAALKVQPKPNPSVRSNKFTYNATDKVALLIGCYDYRSDRLLSAPGYDVQTLSSIFQSMNFKVVSLLNLTKSELLAAVDEFSKLVWKGVYCVFYFCGHGYEVSNQCFLVPVDAPFMYQHPECVAANSIFDCLLKRDPQICCMILDICRKPYIGQPPEVPLSQQTYEKGNAIVCYGTSHGLAAYESKNYGILVKHLKNIVGQPLDIESVFRKLREAINEDPMLNNNGSKQAYKQIPEVRTNLLEPRRSFTDPIDIKGNTEIYHDKTKIWELAHRKPDSFSLDVKFDNFIVKVNFDFQQEFSNVLKIYTSILDPGPTQSCVAYVSGVPADVAEKAKVRTISTGLDSRLKKNFVVIHNIQRLKKPMKINVTISCKVPDCKKTIESIDLGLPLIARLNLWKERPDFLSQRFPEEVAENEDSIL
ncbi:mucosa-associated lymphoid tissue lymphoma translocation protein 1 [Biomphalaria pfeifferi]|uniref:Mucosa-associated lymphoid tissue lymphoma translocation protein 1 n=1 Tax=Biomphalaria pfeifferi TaxID=112525 RepID=A0AAD8CCL9_BIOPF|nr:mucosa-associated lymphoid tissue lymphoma translocation protein 1 [Biomphalaria pfeifferi]